MITLFRVASCARDDFWLGDAGAASGSLPTRPRPDRAHLG
jgi:hypothetical protein